MPLMSPAIIRNNHMIRSRGIMRISENDGTLETQGSNQQK
jgi:hypothetical protein